VVITEVGGTVGEDQSLPFKAIRHGPKRLAELRQHSSDVMPYCASGELKLSQPSIPLRLRELVSRRYFACRAEEPFEELRDKMGRFATSARQYRGAGCRYHL
jgi:CTP synthase (UTP-ammonia lyase)